MKRMGFAIVILFCLIQPIVAAEEPDLSEIEMLLVAIGMSEPDRNEVLADIKNSDNPEESKKKAVNSTKRAYQFSVLEEQIDFELLMNKFSSVTGVNLELVFYLNGVNILTKKIYKSFKAITEGRYSTDPTPAVSLAFEVNDTDKGYVLRKEGMTADGLLTSKNVQTLNQGSVCRKAKNNDTSHD